MYSPEVHSLQYIPLLPESSLFGTVFYCREQNLPQRKGLPLSPHFPQAFSKHLRGFWKFLTLNIVFCQIHIFNESSPFVLLC